MFEFRRSNFHTCRRRSASLALIAVFSLSAFSPAIAQTAPQPEHIRANDNRTPAGRLNGRQLSIELEAREGLWFPEGHEGPGVPVQAFAERGKPLLIPGPLMRVPEGTHIRAIVRNMLAVKLTLHGFHTHPGERASTVEIAPGETREIEFDAGAPGTYFYWGSTMQGGPVMRSSSAGLAKLAFHAAISRLLSYLARGLELR